MGMIEIKDWILYDSVLRMVQRNYQECKVKKSLCHRSSIISMNSKDNTDSKKINRFYQPRKTFESVPQASKEDERGERSSKRRDYSNSFRGQNNRVSCPTYHRVSLRYSSIPWEECRTCLRPLSSGVRYITPMTLHSPNEQKETSLGCSILTRRSD